MPYIMKADRERFDPLISALADEIKDGMSTGACDLSYILTKICDAYVERRGKNYASVAEVIGGLECVKMEYGRRVLEPLLDDRKGVHGDVR